MSNSRLISFLRFWAPLLFIAWCFYLGLQDAMRFFLFYGAGSIRVDADTSLLADALALHPNLSQTTDWWTGPWYQQVPYFRPLSMMLFWAQYRAFGPNNLLAFEAAHWLFLGLVLVLLYGFFSQIAGRGRAAFAVGMFAAGANSLAYQITGTDAFNCWKDSVDAWHLGFFTLSSWCFLLFLRRDKSGDERKFLFASLGFWFCAVAIKESGYCLPFMLPVLLWHERKLRSHWKYAAIFFALAPLLWAYRWHALGGWGNRFGSNGAWKHRVLVDAVGLPGNLANGDTLGLAVVLALLFLVWAWRVRECGERNRALLWILGGATLASLWQAGRFIDGNVGIALSLLGIDKTWFGVEVCAFIMALYAQFLLRRDRAQIFAAGWIFATFIPLAMQPPTSSHAHYPVAPGWSLFLTCALWALPSTLKSAWLWLKPLPPIPKAQTI